MIPSGNSLISLSRCNRITFSIFKRLKSKKSFKEKKNRNCDRALAHFDDFYGAVFLKKWPSVRLGLLSRQKQLAVINNFGNIEETEEFLQNEGAFELRPFLNALKQNHNPPAETHKQKIDLGDVILRQRELEQEKALDEIFPKDKDIDSKNAYFDSKNNKVQTVEDWDPEDPKTSLKSDLLGAEIDTSRLILPDSAEKDSLLQDYMPVTQLRGLEGFVPEAEYYKYYQSKLEMPVGVEDELELEFPESLKVYTFDRGDMSQFLDPKRCDHGVYNYLTVDGADLLTALVLGADKEDKVLDFCSPNGTISYCIFQTLPQLLICIDGKEKHTERIFSEYLFDYSPSWKDLLLVTSQSFIAPDDSNLFDKVLVDVPCTEDKLSVFEEEENIFNPKLIKKRLGLPQFQCLLLTKALKLVKPGGAVVYTTTTLSPVQNDGVVGEALKTVWQESKMECSVRNLAPALSHTSEFFHFADYLPMKFGTLVVPFVPTNFGPRYFCKIIKKN